MIRQPLRRCCQPINLLFLTVLLSFIFTSSGFTQSQDDDEVVRVNTDLVVLNVTVVDKAGNFVHGLKSSDFKLFVDGKEQPISRFLREETPFAAAILLDTSGSMENRLTLARSAAIRFLDDLREEDVTAIYRFDSEIKRVQDFSSSHDMADFAFGMRAQGMTALNDAIVFAAKDLSQRTENRRAIVILSDGADNKSSATAGKALERALAANATIYAVDMSSTQGALGRNQSSAASLQDFAAKSGGRYVSSPGGSVLRDAFIKIVEELSNQYTLTYSPPDNARDGRWHKLEVQLSRPDMTLRTRKGYHAPKK